MSGVSNPAYKPKHLHTLALTDYVQFAMAVSDRDAGLVFIHDYMAGLIKTIEQWSAADGSIATFEYGPQGVCFDDDNILVICDSNDDSPTVPPTVGQVHVFDAVFSYSDSWVPQKRPTRCAADGDYIYVISKIDGYISKYSYGGIHILSDDLAVTLTPYDSPAGVAELGDYLYIADTGNNRVVKIQKSDLTFVGAFDVENDEGLPVDPIDVAVDDDGNIYVLAEEEIATNEYHRTIQIYNSAFALQRTIFGATTYTGAIRSIALTPLKDIYYIDASRWEVGSLILPFKNMGSWIGTIDAGDPTEFTSASWNYEIGTVGQEVTGSVAVSSDGATYTGWSMAMASGMPIPPGFREGRCLKVKLELRQPSGLEAPTGWFDSPRVTSVLVLWEEAVITFLEGKISFYLQDPKILGDLQPILEMPFARVTRFEGEPQYISYPPGLGYTKPVDRPQHVSELFSVTSDFYEKAQSYSTVTDMTKQYYIVLTHENENTGLVQHFTFWLCDFRGHSFSASDGGGPSQITLTYRPKLVT